MSVFFYSLHVNKNTDKVTVICTDKAVTDAGVAVSSGGLNFAMGSGSGVQYGVLAFRDTETGKPVQASTWSGMETLKGWTRGLELKNLKMGENKVIDQKTGEATSMVWVEPA
jgi:hypothetical protein|tara:strand:+ start:1640 stop:1975 length:336 start_codon:yes stop_codon:yes gene_type:complete